MRALNIFSMITVLFFLVLALFLKPVVMETVEMLSEPMETKCNGDEVVRMIDDELASEEIKNVVADTSWPGLQSLD